MLELQLNRVDYLKVDHLTVIFGGGNPCLLLADHFIGARQMYATSAARKPQERHSEGTCTCSPAAIVTFDISCHL